VQATQNLAGLREELAVVQDSGGYKLKEALKTRDDEIASLRGM